MYSQLSLPMFLKNDLIYLICNINTDLTENHKVYRDLKNVDYALLSTNCNLCDWDSIYDYTNINSELTVLQDNIIYLYNRSVPLVSKMTKPRENPWFKTGIKVLIDNRDNAFKKRKRYKTSQHAAQYKTLRKNVSQLINQEKRKYFFTRFNRATSSQQEWVDIKKLGIGKSNTTRCDDNPDELNKKI